MGKEEVRILYLEDDIADQEILEEILMSVDNFAFDLKRVEDMAGLEAELTGNSQKYDIILMDLGLKSTQGMETYREYCKLGFKFPVIIITGLDDEELGLQLVSECAQDYLVKGKFNGEMAVRAIRYARERYKTECELRRHRDHLEELVKERTSDLEDKYLDLAKDFEMLLVKEDTIKELREEIRNLKNQ